ncbi:hypothetical protein B0H10DRAFT_2186656 [Mycena sp. CBHHK59/15]|nr:hypothetical protein B0H10DRAFT_2186656 [Mycena sp. CBHHK59/15]
MQSTAKFAKTRGGAVQDPGCEHARTVQAKPHSMVVPQKSGNDGTWFNAVVATMQQYDDCVHDTGAKFAAAGDLCGQLDSRNGQNALCWRYNVYTALVRRRAGHRQMFPTESTSRLGMQSFRCIAQIEEKKSPSHQPSTNKWTRHAEQSAGDEALMMSPRKSNMRIQPVNTPGSDRVLQAENTRSNVWPGCVLTGARETKPVLYGVEANGPMGDRRLNRVD